MKQRVGELKKVECVEEVLPRRFVANGYDTFAKIAVADAQGLKKIDGLNPGMIQPLCAQAGAMINEIAYGKNEKIENLKQKSESLKVQIRSIALSIRDCFKYEVSGKIQRKLEKDIVRLTSSLERVRLKLGSKIKKSDKWLLKAEKHLTSLVDAKPKDINKGLIKALKLLQRVHA